MDQSSLSSLSELSKMSDPDFIFWLKEFGGLCAGHRAFTEGAPACVPGPEQYTTIADQMAQLLISHPQTKQTNEQMHALRDKGRRYSVYTTQYLVMFSDHHNDPSLLPDLGLEQRSRTSRKKKIATPPIPSRYLLKDLPAQGEFEVSVANRPARGSVEVQVNEVSANDEGSWRRTSNYYTSKFAVKGLDPVKKYWVRIRFDGRSGPGPWSGIQSIVVS